MADNQKYYYMRLKESFFDEDAIKIIEAMPDGYLYSNILLKLYLKSLKNNGKLMFNDRIPYNPTVLATITHHQVGTVEKALELFEQMGLIEVLDNGAIYMLDIQNLIGKSSTEAERRKAYRAKIEAEKARLTDNGQMSGQTPPEIDIELKQELKLDLNTDIASADKNSADDVDISIAIKNFIEYRKTANKPMTKQSIELLKAELDKLAPNDSVTQIAIINQSIMNGWSGVFPLKIKDKPRSREAVPDWMKDYDKDTLAGFTKSDAELDQAFLESKAAAEERLKNLCNVGG